MDGCVWKEQNTRLINRFSRGSAAIAIKDGEGALICFNVDENKKCEIFDASGSASTYAANYGHYGGKLGFYNGKPTTVGTSLGNKTEKKKVEVLDSSGWSFLSDFP